MTQTNATITEEQVKSYLEILKLEEAKYHDLIAKAERKLSVLKQRMSDPARWLVFEIKENSLRSRAVRGESVAVARHKFPKKGEIENSAIPESDLKAIKGALKKEELREPPKKTSGFGFFTRDAE